MTPRIAGITLATAAENGLPSSVWIRTLVEREVVRVDASGTNSVNPDIARCGLRGRAIDGVGRDPFDPGIKQTRTILTRMTPALEQAARIIAADYDMQIAVWVKALVELELVRLGKLAMPEDPS